jgi:hypothetical protein
MQFQRASINPKRVSADWVAKYKAGGQQRAQLFKLFLDKNGKVDDVEIELKHEKENKNKNTNNYGWRDRAAIMKLYDNDVDAVESVIDSKTRQGLFRRSLNSFACLRMQSAMPQYGLGLAQCA